MDVIWFIAPECFFILHTQVQDTRCWEEECFLQIARCFPQRAEGETRQLNVESTFPGKKLWMSSTGLITSTVISSGRCPMAIELQSVILPQLKWIERRLIPDGSLSGLQQSSLVFARFHTRVRADWLGCGRAAESTPGEQHRSKDLILASFIGIAVECAEDTVVFGLAVQEDEFLEAQYAIGPSERVQKSPCAGDKGLPDPMTRMKSRPKKLLFTKVSGTIGLGHFSRLPGSSRKAQKYKWVRDIVLSEKFLRLFCLVRDKDKVVGDMGERREGTWYWNFSWSRRLMQREECKVDDLLDLIGDRQPNSETKDAWRWEYTKSGEYTVKSEFGLKRTLEDSHYNCSNVEEIFGRHSVGPVQHQLHSILGCGGLHRCH
ncbi:hypothetical protein Ancab_033237 [Ancistrocladus abbreviatus]